MKKNNMLRIASVLLVAVLLSTCAISGAFAKYTTSLTSESETARVAKFGITLAAAKPDMFKGAYGAKEVDLNGAENGLGLSVSATTDVLAPGTNEALANCFTITQNDREVAVNVAYTVNVTLDGWTYDKEVITDGVPETKTFDYCPIIITVGAKDYYVGMDDEVTNSAKLAEAVSKAASVSADYAVGATTIDVAPAISWRWNFEKENALTGSIQNDVEDTILGKAGSATVTINVTATVTQID